MPVIACEVRCAGTPESLDLVQDALAELWTAAEEGGEQPGDIDRMLFETALVEILGNVVEHGRTAAGEPVDVGVALEVHADRVVAVLRDNGVEPELDLGEAALPGDELAEDGRGFALAGAVAEVGHTREGAANVWRVVRHRS